MDDDEWERRRRAQLAYRARVGFTGTKRRAEPGTFTHGTRYGYQIKKCRCDRCRDWELMNHRLRRKRKRRAA